MTPEEWQEFLDFQAFKKQIADRASAQKAPQSETVASLQSSYEIAVKSKIPSWNSCQRFHWKHLLPFWGALTIDECTWDKGDEYQRMRVTQKRLAPGGLKETKHITAPRTVNMEMNTLRACFNWALKRHKIQSNPLTGHTDLPDGVDPKSDRKFPIPYEHFVKILEKLPPYTQQMMIFGYETGMRRDEFRLLEWPEVDLTKDTKTVFLSKYRTKAKKERTIVLSDIAVAIINAAPRVVPSKYVFPNTRAADGSPMSKGTLGSQWRAAREKAGVKGPQGQDYWIHSIRKSYGANKAMQGMPIYMLMEQMGHSDKNVHDEYTKMSPGHLGAVVEHQNKPAPRMGPRSIECSAVHDAGTLAKFIK